MSGEYLPDFDGDEVEIARVTLASVTGDVISIRARGQHALIHYRIVDEYEDQGSVYHCEPEELDTSTHHGRVDRLVETRAAKVCIQTTGRG